MKDIVSYLSTFGNPALKDFPSAYAAGRDAAERGPNVRNCHFGWFGSRESTSEWERGNREGLKGWHAFGYGISAHASKGDV